MYLQAGPCSRFATRFGFAIDPPTLAAIRAEPGQLMVVSAERIGEEIVRILTEGAAKAGFELLDATGLLVLVLPEIAAMKGCEQSRDYHPEGDVFVHTLGLLAQLDHHTETVALGALLHDIAKPQCAQRTPARITFYGHCEQGAEVAVAICQRLRRSRETWERVDYLVRNHLRPLQAPDMRLSTLKRFLAEDGIDELLELARLDALASNQDLTYVEFCQSKREEFGATVLRPAALVRGRDLIDLGLRPGPRFNEILNAVADAQLEGRLRTRDAAVAWVREEFLKRKA